MKKVFILKSKNEITGETASLSSFAFKDYQTAVEELKTHLLEERIEYARKNNLVEIIEDEDGDDIENFTTDMTEILKGFIEVYETEKGQYHEIFNKDAIKTYNYNF